MTCVRVASSCAILLLLLGLSGCMPMGDSQVDEQKEPHFLAGRNRYYQMDFNGAIDEYEKALLANPQNAAAHWELGMLYEQQRRDYAAAIYHYQRFLQFRPNSERSPTARDHIENCKVELSSSVSALYPRAQLAQQREFDRLLLENRQLTNQLAQWQAAYYNLARQIASNREVAVSAPAPAVPPATNYVAPAPPRASPGENSPSLSSRPAPNPGRLGSTGPVRQHVVRVRETPASIARHYGISLSTLLAANPQLKPTHMMVGQTLTIPSGAP